MSSPPVGRAFEWATLYDRLSTRRSALILIAGVAGSGRTHLLRSFGQAATEAGFRAAGFDPDEPLVIEPTTKLTDVRRALAGVLGETMTDPPGASTPPLALVRRILRTMGDSLKDEEEVFALIDSRAPLVIGVDGYEPSGTLGLWVASRLVPHIRETAKPVVLVLVDRPERLAPLREIADTVVEVGPLDLQAVADHLRDSTRDALRPLSEDEVTAYSEAAADDPALLRAFDSVLVLLPGGP
jgi:hypothetical protein